jgi:Cdc6-like AAA superfamily ATPase
MPCLSFEQSKGARPVAIVKGGEEDGSLLFLNDEDMRGNKKGSALNSSKYANELRTVKPSERVKLLARLEEARDKGLEPDQLIGESSLGKQLFERILSDETTNKDITLESGSFELLPSPDPKKREVWYIAGASGSGKSYVAKGLGEYYQKLYPDRSVYLISKLAEDAGTLDKMKPKPKRINIQSLIDDFPDLDEFKNCMVIFDDYDTFTGAAEKVVHKLIDDLATMGRHTNTSMLCLSHYLTNYKKTRLLLNEATHIVVYPMATSYHALSYLLKTHIGMSKDDIRDLKKMGRWVMIYKSFPQYLISSSHARMLIRD